MAGLAETRKFCAQSLRKAGKACDVPLIRDTAAREKVAEFAQAISQKRKAGKACDVPLIRDTAAREKVAEFAQAIGQKRMSGTT